MKSTYVFLWALGLAARAAATSCANYTDCVSCTNDTECAWISDIWCNDTCVEANQITNAYRNKTTDSSTCGDTAFSCKYLGAIEDPSFEVRKKANPMSLDKWIEERKLTLHQSTNASESQLILMYPIEGNFFTFFGGHQYLDKNQDKKDPKYLYQYQLRNREVMIPESATHLSFFIRVPNSHSDITSFTILIDRNPVFSIDKDTASKYASDGYDYHSKVDNIYIEVDIRNIESNKNFADGKTHQIVLNFMIYFTDLSSTTPNGIALDFIQFISKNRIGNAGAKDISDNPNSRWCPTNHDDTVTIQGTYQKMCYLGCINVYKSAEFNSVCSHYSDSDKKYLTSIIIIIIIVGVVVIALILSGIVVMVFLKLRKKRNIARATAVDAYDAQAEDTNDDWGFNKKSLSFNQNDDETNDCGTVLKDTVTISNKEYESITITLDTPRNDKYEVTTKESKFTIKKGDSVKVKFLLRLFCSVNINDNVIVNVKATGSNAKNAKNKKIAVFFNGHVDRIDSSDIVKGEPVGNGSFGEVCKGSYKGTPIVIKSVKKNTSKAMNKYAKNIKQIVDVSADSKFLVKLYGISETADTFNVVTEFIPLGSVSSAFKGPSKELKIKSLWDISRGIESLHARNIIHGDLKPGNVLCVDNSDPRVEINCKVSDFGEFGFIAGTGVKETSIIYAAPEILNKVPNYNNKIDTYSFGVTAIEILSESKPYSDSNLTGHKLTKHIINGGRPNIPDWCSAELTNLIKRCLDASPKARPTFSEITKNLETELLKINPDALSLCTEAPVYYNDDDDDDDDNRGGAGTSSNNNNTGDVEMNILSSTPNHASKSPNMQNSMSSGNASGNGMNPMMMTNNSMNNMMMANSGMNPMMMTNNSMNSMMMTNNGMNPMMMTNNGMNNMMMTNNSMNNMMMTNNGMNGMMMTNNGMSGMMMTNNGMNGMMMTSNGMNY